MTVPNGSPSSKETDSRTIVITGASRGIGAATARHLATPNQHLLLVARTDAKLQEVKREVEKQGGRATVIPADLSTHQGTLEGLEAIAEHTDHVDIAILNAGVSNNASFLKAERDDAHLEMMLNFFSPLQMTRAFLPRMVERQDGAIIFVGSLTALVPFPGNATYAASKAALFGFVRSLRLEIEATRVHVGIVLPGLTDTDLTREMESLGPRMPPEEVAQAIERCIVRRDAVVTPGYTNKLAAQLFQLFPDFSETLVRSFGRKLVPGWSREHG